MGFFDIFKKNKPEVPPIVEEQEKVADAEALEQGLEKTKTSFFSKISKALVGRTTVDVDFLDDLEDALVSADVGVQTTVKIIKPQHSH